MTQPTLVSIGVPVRNGAPFLDEALTLLRQQTYPHLEIIVSDNASDDGSPKIIQRHAAQDSRIRVHRHDTTLTAVANFRFVFEQAHGEFFMWAACDDRRSLDNVERLLAVMQARPDASIVFGDVAEFSDPACWRAVCPLQYSFETLPGETPRELLMRYTRINCLHIYGLIRHSMLRTYLWHDIDNGPDIPLLVHLAFLGEFVRAEGGCFYYYVPPVPKTMEERAVTNGLRQLKRFPELRLAWACAQAASRAAHLRGTNLPRLPAFLLVYANRHWRWLKPWLFEISPAFAVTAYRRWFKRGHK